MTTTFNFPETDIVGCRFPKCNGRNGEITVDNTSKEYFYKLLPGMPKPKLGDFLVTSCSNGFQVCVVTTLNAMSNFKDLAYAVGAVDVQYYKDALRRKDLLDAAYAQLMRKKKELEESVTLDLLAEKSPEFAALLQTYRGLLF